MQAIKKRILAVLLCVALAFAALPVSSAAASGMDAFTLPDELPQLPFEDVVEGKWFYTAVQVQYALGLMSGTSETEFSPSGTVSLWQAVAVTVRVYEAYHGIDPEPTPAPEPTEPSESTEPVEPVEPSESTEPTEPVEPSETTEPAEPAEPTEPTEASEPTEPSESTEPTEPLEPTEPTEPVDPPEPHEPWYITYGKRAAEYGLLPDTLENVDLSRPATRAEVAELLFRSLPTAELTAINMVSSLPDYVDFAPYWNSVITLYQAGILSGQDKYGTFCPENSIRRSELASMLTRLVCPERREKKTFSPAPTGMKVFSVPSNLQNPYTDVPANSWYAKFVKIQYALGLMSGTGKNKFSPDGTATVAQITAVAVRVYERYHAIPNGSAYYGGQHWYDYAMTRGTQYGLLPKSLQQSPNRAATRAEVAEILYRSLPKSEFTAINTVSGLPDYTAGDPYYSSVIALYRAGILSGSDPYGTFNAKQNIHRAELASMLTRLVCPQYRHTFVLQKKPYYETITYGTSGAGRKLTAYRFGDGKNVMVLTFAIHGWEDNFDRDGQLLVDTANQLMNTLRTNYNTLIASGDWSVYVLPTLNPDGLYDGWTCNGPGRCTTHYLTISGGDVTGKGIDMNRCFPYKFTPRSDSRNFNGTQPLQTKEAQALAKFTRSVKGSAKNVLIDTHGWYNQTIVSSGQSSKIYQAFRASFPATRYTSLSGGSGYYSSWAGYELGYDACLFEFPNVFSKRDFQNHGYADAFIRAISQLLKSY